MCFYLFIMKFVQLGIQIKTHTHTHTRLTALFGTTHVSRYQKGKTNLDFTAASDSEWKWYQLGRMQVCTSLQTDNHASTPPLSFLQAGCPSCCPTNSVKALKALALKALHNTHILTEKVRKQKTCKRNGIYIYMHKTLVHSY